MLYYVYTESKNVPLLNCILVVASPTRPILRNGQKRKLITDLGWI